MRYEMTMRGWAALLSTLVLAFPQNTFAQSRPSVSFSWVRTEGAASCPSASTLRTEVAGRLGYHPFSTSAPIALEGVVERAEDRWAVRLYRRDEEGVLLGQRELASSSPDCRSLADAIALAMALAIDPEAALAAPELASEAEAEPEAEPEPGPESEPEPEPNAEPNSGPRISLGAAFAYRIVPGLGAGVRLAVDGPIAAHVRWMGSVLYLPERVARRDGAKFGAGSTSIGLGLCAGARIGRIAIEGCGAIDVGGLHVVVYDPTPTDPGDRVYVAGSATLRVATQVWRGFSIGLWAGANVPFIDYDFRVNGQPDAIFSPATVAPFGGIELQADFGSR